MPTAFVTGASRGIGKSIAVYLARAGFDVALTARSVQEGEQREHSTTRWRSDTSPLPGSLTTTAELVAAAGSRALVLPADLTDRASVLAAADAALAEWGRIDVLVNNGRYVGPGHDDRVEDTPLDVIDLHLEANVMAPIALTKRFLPAMLEHGGGTIVNITSGVAWHDPTKPPGDGGWGLVYAISKGALHRVAGVLAVELGDRGIWAYNVQPGAVATERRADGAPADVIGAVVAWLVTDPAAAAPNGRSVEAQDVCRERELLAGWPS